eukprot:s1182_g16.t1
MSVLLGLAGLENALVAGGHACTLPAAAELSLQSAAAILEIRNETTARWPASQASPSPDTCAAGQHPQRHHGPVLRGQHGHHGRDRALKGNVQAIPDEELQQTFDAVEPQLFDRIGAGKDQIGFVAHVQASGPLGATMCKTKNLDGRELMALDYQKLSVVLWGVVKKLQKRVERLEKKKKNRKDDSD